MLNSQWLFAPVVLQMLLAVADEHVFHRKRGLPRWERLGHPLDTLTVASCLVWILLVPPRPRAVGIFAALAVFSTIFVTKDEGVHHRKCSAAEHWLHACLFTLHPVVLASAGLMWPAVHGLSVSAGWIQFGGSERMFLLLACSMTVVFAVYQFAFWNLPWKRNRTR